MTAGAVREATCAGLSEEDALRVGATVAHALAVRDATPRAISAVESRPSLYQSSCSLHDVDVCFDDGSTLAMVAKAADWSAMCPEAHRARPRWLWDEKRERVVYESILPAADMATARYFGSYVSESGVRHLLLERVDGVPLWQSGNFDTWCEAARWLARMSVQVTVATIAATRASARLLRYERPFYETWIRRACAFYADTTPSVTTLSKPYQKVVDWLACECPVFLHGEFYSSNVLVERDASRRDLVRPVDWELAALGPASIDLACLLSGRWTDAERSELAAAYYGELSARGVRVPDRERYLRTLDYSLIHLSVRNLGWSADWTPPSDRAHDWLGEAIRLCDKWDL
jgi:phosphotransferase family enzyme